MGDRILTLNGGSSSLKFALFAPGHPPVRELAGRIERIGTPEATLVVSNIASKATSAALPIAAIDLGAAAARMFGLIEERRGLAAVSAVGHRIVHGGSSFTESQRVTPALIAELHCLAPLDPEHLPGEIAVLEAAGQHLPKATQIACFDTAFHRDLPRAAQLLPLPAKYFRDGIRRFGFHGLSYAYLLQELTRVAGPVAARGRVVLAHLGNGASMAAVRDGKCIDTTMAFTPTAGLVMASRSGDLDPGVLIHLARTENLSPDDLDNLVNRRSGMAGLSETSGDVRDLLSRRATDSRADDALSVFCYQARKWIGSMSAALGGLDTLVFAGGIGENAPTIRAEICRDLRYLGLEFDDTQNSANAGVISTADSRCTVRVLHTDEEIYIAGEVLRLLPTS